VPLDLSAAVMTDCFRSFLPAAKALEEVIVCVIDHREYAPFQARLQNL
jgi:hypothetical protein